MASKPIQENQHSSSPILESKDNQKSDADNDNNFEVFKKKDGVVDFRTVTWVQASVIFLKTIFATGVLSIPSALYVLGAFPGAINIVGWQIINTYGAIVLGNFRNTHAGCHSIADLAGVVGGRPLKEVIGALFMLSWVTSAASGVVGTSVALNVLSDHALCTNSFMVISAVAIFVCASVRKFEKLVWLTWAGFLSIYVAVFIVVVAVTTRSRPVAAPQTGDYELGFRAIGHPSFAAGITAVATIFVAGSGTSAFIPVIAEMRKPRDYNKAVYLSMGIVGASYLTFSLVVYRWCGKWVATPSLGSAGGTTEKVAYGIGLIGLVISSCLWIHSAAKYLFVRILRNSVHLQSQSLVHWSVWLACTFGLTLVAFIFAIAIPIFNYLLALSGSIAAAPLALGLPPYLWLYDHRHEKGTLKMNVMRAFHWFIIALAAFLTVGGTYGTIQSIIDAYANGMIGRTFSCADNSKG